MRRAWHSTRSAWAAASADPRKVWRTLAEHWEAFAGTASGYWIEEALAGVLGITEPLDSRQRRPHLRPHPACDRHIEPSDRARCSNGSASRCWPPPTIRSTTCADTRALAATALRRPRAADVPTGPLPRSRRAAGFADNVAPAARRDRRADHLRRLPGGARRAAARTSSATAPSRPTTASTSRSRSTSTPRRPSDAVPTRRSPGTADAAADVARSAGTCSSRWRG